jgi:ligand-binding sensor domain-containing protein/DNA-binding CsgD family transcriptional regulator
MGPASLPILDNQGAASRVVVGRALVAVIGSWLLATLTSTAAASPFTPVGVSNGLKARVVPSLLLDDRGFLWAGSREGLFRYDGYETLSFEPDVNDPNALSDSDVRSLYQDRFGTIWVGTYAGGLERYDSDTATFTHFRHDAADPTSILDGSVLAIVEGPEGRLWVATENGLSRLEPEAQQFEHFSHDPATPTSLSSNRISTLHRGAQGRLWIGTIGGGVNRWNPQSRSFARLDIAAITGGPSERNDVFSLHEDRTGRLWVGTRVGLVLLDPASATGRELPLPWASDFPPTVTAMAEDDFGRLWLGTLAHGVLTIDLQTARWEERPGSPEERLQDKPQISLTCSQDMLFVGTWGDGIYRTTSHATRFVLLKGIRAGELRDENITAVMAASEPGRPWVGARDDGVLRVDPDSRALARPPELSGELTMASVLGLARDAQGQNWAAASSGLYRFTETGRQTGHWAHDPRNPQGIGEGFVRVLLPDGPDGLWIGTDGAGLYRLSDDGRRLDGYRHEPGVAGSISGDYITALLDDPGGFLWVGTRSNGLNRCRLEPWSCEHLGDTGASALPLGRFGVTALYRDRESSVWVGTGNGGVSEVLQDAAGRVTGFRHWTRNEGLLDDGIMAIQQDRDDSLWLATRLGLSRLQAGTGQVINYVAESGLPTSLFNGNASAADQRYIYFGSVDGLLRLPKGSGFARREAAKVHFAAIERTAPGGPAHTVYGAREELVVPYREVLSIRLAVLDLSESVHEYAYRLQDEEPWINLGAQRQLILHGLAPGEYALQARGRDVFGLWGISPTLKLTITPPWWMTNTVRLCAIILLLAAAIAIHLARQSALQRRAREVQRLSEKREHALEEQLGSEAELAVLTPRQKEILQLLAEGHSTRDIAERLGVSIKTVEAHRANLMDRLEIHDLPGLVRLAIRSRLVSPYD